MSKINIDAQIIHHATEKMIELSNGCICCTLREDLLTQLMEINEMNSCDSIIIESTGIAEPLHIAETFAYMEQLMKKEKKELNIKLDTMITVVDLQTFIYHYTSNEIPTQCSSSSLNEATNTTTTTNSTIVAPEDRTLSHLLIDQIQFADLIILNKCDLVPLEQQRDIEGIVKDLNPHAKIILSTFGQHIPRKKLLNTGLFSFKKAEEHQEWFQTEWGVSSSTPETIEYDITSITFQTQSRPFHPQRLYDFYTRYTFSNHTPSTPRKPILLRSKGFIWLPFDYSHYYLLHHTGGSLSVQLKDLWWICKDTTLWPTSNEFEEEIGYLLHGDRAVKYGDRGNTLILIGQHCDEQKWNEIREELRVCLFTDDEMEKMNGNEENEEWINEWKKQNPFKEIIKPIETSHHEEEDDGSDDGTDDEEKVDDTGSSGLEVGDNHDEDDEEKAPFSQNKKRKATNDRLEKKKRG